MHLAEKEEGHKGQEHVNPVNSSTMPVASSRVGHKGAWGRGYVVGIGLLVLTRVNALEEASTGTWIAPFHGDCSCPRAHCKNRGSAQNPTTPRPRTTSHSSPSCGVSQRILPLPQEATARTQKKPPAPRPAAPRRPNAFARHRGKIGNVASQD